MRPTIVILDNCRNRVRHFRHLSRHSVYFLLQFQWFTRLLAFGMGHALSNRANHMFKISTIDTGRERRLIVEGTLVKPWVAELRRAWTDAGQSLEGRTLVIDLNNATVISREGEGAIFELMKEGAKFSCGGVLTKHVLKQLAQRCHTTFASIVDERCSKLKRQ